jgi:hypothetical protein
MVANDFLIRAAKAAAQAARSRYEDDVELYYRIVRAVLAEVAKPSSTMIDAAYEAVRFDEAWAINSRRDFQKALRAMVRHVDRLWGVASQYNSHGCYLWGQALDRSSLPRREARSVGERKALAIATRGKQMDRRWSKLKERLV